MTKASTDLVSTRHVVKHVPDDSTIQTVVISVLCAVVALAAVIAIAVASARADVITPTISLGASLLAFGIATHQRRKNVLYVDKAGNVFRELPIWKTGPFTKIRHGTDGIASIEYAMLAVGVALAILAGAQLLGSSINNGLSSIGASVTSDVAGGAGN